MPVHPLFLDVGLIIFLLFYGHVQYYDPHLGSLPFMNFLRSTTV
jgi:hypothetical protein